MPKKTITAKMLKDAVREAVKKSVERRDQDWMRAVENYRRKMESCFSVQSRTFDAELHRITFDTPPALRKVTVKIEKEKRS